MGIDEIANRHFEGKLYYALNSYPTKFMARYFGMLYKADSETRSYRVTEHNGKFRLWVNPGNETEVKSGKD